jgi:hypothetical protein
VPPHGRPIPAPQRFAERRLNLWGSGPAWLVTLAPLIGIWTAIKAINLDVIVWGEYPWVIDYSQGFIKRGFAGHIFRNVCHALGITPSLQIVPFIHIVLLLAFVVFATWLAAAALRGSPGPGDRWAVAVASVVLLASPVLMTQAMLTGYLDLALCVVLLLAACLFAADRPMAACAVACVGPLVHEGFVFLWLPVALVTVIPMGAGLGVQPKAIAAYVPPLLVGAGVLIAHDARALQTVLSQAPLPESRIDTLIAVQFGQTPLSAFESMITRYRVWHGNVAKAVLFFLPPVLVFALAAAWLPERAPRIRRALALRTALGFLAGASALGFAWDLSRLLQWGVLSSAVVLLLGLARAPCGDARRTARPPPTGPRMRPWPRAFIGLALAVAGFYVFAPVVYAYFGWARAYTPTVPRNVFATAPGLATAAFVNWYNAAWTAEHAPDVLCATRAQGGHRRPRAPCTATVAAGETWYSQARKLRAGVHRLRVGLRPGQGCSGAHARLTWYLNGNPRIILKTVSKRVDAPDGLAWSARIGALAAATSDLRLRVKAEDGCLALTAVTHRTPGQN